MRTNTPIIILGAGLSGLTAGYYLKQKYPVLILEGRDRLGGRVDTRLIDPQENLVVEMGGEWIGKEHLKIIQLVKRFDLKLVSHQLKAHLLLNHRHYQPGKWNYSKQWRWKLKSILKHLKLMTTQQLAALDDISLHHFLLKNHIADRDLKLIELIEGTNYGLSMKDVSSYDLLVDTLIAGHAGDQTDYYWIKGGNKRLVDALAKKVGQENILLNQTVVKVVQQQGRVVVTCLNGQSYLGRAVVCSLPTTAVVKINWQPGLPRDQWQALSNLKYGQVTKTTTLFAKRFWLDPAFEVITDQKIDLVYHATQNQLGVKGALTGYSIGERARSLSRLSPEEQSQQLCWQLSPILGDGSNLIIKTLTSSWGDDAFVQGAFAIFAPHQFLTYKPRLRRPFQRVFFAGEHLAQFQGYMEGAVETGEKAATDVRRFLS